MVFCFKCGTQLGDGTSVVFCPSCGADQRKVQTNSTPVPLTSSDSSTHSSALIDPAVSVPSTTRIDEGLQPGAPMKTPSTATNQGIETVSVEDPDDRDTAFDDLADNPFDGSESKAPTKIQAPVVPPRVLPAPPPPAAPSVSASSSTTKLPPPTIGPRPASFARPPSANMSAASADNSARGRLIAFYQRYNPAKFEEPGFSIDATLEAYRGREAQLFIDLENKYSIISSASPRLDRNPSSTTNGVPPRSAGPAGTSPARPVATNNVGASTREYKSSDSGAVSSIIEGLKFLYKNKIRPVEAMFKFGEFQSPMLTDTDLEAKPMVLLLGQYSTGKTTFIQYLLEREYPGQRIGPEPTTDRFVAVMWGHDERVIPGNALAVQADKPFTALQKFGMSFLNKFEAGLCPCPILENLTFIDTPGVLSGEKQRIGRSYDFPEVIEWFAERVDRIILLFDAHKLDISDEFKSAIECLKGHDDKIRVILNKADGLTGQQLMRVYGALMWSLGKVIATPEVLRVYIGSFWDQPLKNSEHKALFEAESNDLLADLRSLPRNSAVRKVNELVKRARMAKVHAYLIAHLRDQFGWFGKGKKQQQLIGGLIDEFRKVQVKYNLPKGDFPNLRKFKEKLQTYEIHKFPKLDPSMLDAMDQVLAVDIPRLMKSLPGSNAHDADDFKYGSVLNPFDDKNISLRAPAGVQWSIDSALKSKYDNIFCTLRLQGDKAPGGAVRDVFVQSGLPASVLRDVWNLADIDHDGLLDSAEFAVGMYLVESLSNGTLPALPAKLPHSLVPPNKRHLISYG